MPRIRRIAACLLLSAVAAAQAQDLPKDLSGRWSWAARNVSQIFSLENIQRKDADAFTARLTWWTIDARCTLRGEPITGRITPTGLSFEATTKCNSSFTADLQRRGDAWEGQAVTHGGNAVTVDLTAR